MEENRTPETEETVVTEEKKTEKKKSKKNEEINELKGELLKIQEELKASEDKYLRMLAEYDNFRRRTAQEKTGIYADATADTILNVLPALDNLERATAFDNPEKVAEGLSMILKSFSDILAKMNVKEVEALGKTFDPNFHNAVFHIEDENYGESEVVEVLQKGYMLGDKVIRYAIVKVAN